MRIGARCEVGLDCFDIVRNYWWLWALMGKEHPLHWRLSARVYTCSLDNAKQFFIVRLIHFVAKLDVSSRKMLLFSC